MGATQFLFPRSAISPSPSASQFLLQEEERAASSSPETVAAEPTDNPSLPATHPLSLMKGDQVASWDFKGAYADRPDLIKKAEGEVTRLSGLIGSGAYSDMTLYVGIANQYGLLGAGSLEYEYLGRAIRADVNITSGLPWHNLGVLMERLGALETARVAYEKSTLIQPEMKFYHFAYLEFLTARMKDDTTDIEKEYAAAIQNLGQDSDILSLYAEWKNS